MLIVGILLVGLTAIPTSETKTLNRKIIKKKIENCHGTTTPKSCRRFHAKMNGRTMQKIGCETAKQKVFRSEANLASHLAIDPSELSLPLDVSRADPKLLQLAKPKRIGKIKG